MSTNGPLARQAAVGRLPSAPGRVCRTCVHRTDALARGPSTFTLDSQARTTACITKFRHGPVRHDGEGLIRAGARDAWNRRRQVQGRPGVILFRACREGSASDPPRIIADSAQTAQELLRVSSQNVFIVARACWLSQARPLHIAGFPES